MVCLTGSTTCSGLGLVGAQLNKASEGTKEALADLEEMAKLGIDEDDLEEQAQLLEARYWARKRVH